LLENKLNELALFAGAGGGILGGQLLGWRTVCAVEFNPYPASVLAQRQNDGLLPPFPIWDDVRTFDGRPWRGVVDVVSGGFPCQDISAAGKGAGIDGERSGLWHEMARIIDEVRPQYAFVENSPMLVGRGLAVVLGDLASMGFDARWGVLGASDVGAQHKRERCWIVAHARRSESEQRHFSDVLGRRTTETEQTGMGCGVSNVANTDSHDQHRWRSTLQMGRQWRESAIAKDGDAARAEWSTEPDVGRVVDGVAARMDRLTAIGNGQVPQCAAAAWRCLTDNA
jgi:DNA (cytosine-5)-methyltransferase 1